ncbi:thioredoxin [Neptunitalea lumnitzerae]|uniref:Thioredoxin n=1 Tax=Neptunitalea lumnitzerae TaxID=2965509 RepID=A0ABQ5MJD2_9FLAO|nr:thioredoxin [Neptunitalea sp. Y10]GLB49513.1 thioredoxin [Neptunitalea sp. Y10]
MSSFKTLINQSKPVLIDFHAEWCGPCKMMPPILHKIKDKFGDQVSILKIDVDKNQELAAKYQIRGVPTLMLFKEGTQLWRQSGVPTEAQLVEILTPHII